MEAVLRQVEVDLANTDIRSPVNGVIIQRSVELGANRGRIPAVADDFHDRRRPGPDGDRRLHR